MVTHSLGREIRIICLGNELVHDDGVGVRIGRALAALTLPAGVTVELRRTLGFDLLDELDAQQEIILIDATCTAAEPGTLHVMEFGQAADLAEAPYCCHGVGIAEVLQLAARVAPDKLPPRTTIIGIEAKQLESFGLSLSPAVRDAIPKGVHQVLLLLGADEELLAAGHREAVRIQEWQPSIEDVIEV